jgi:hypothetical protein
MNSAQGYLRCMMATAALKIVLTHVASTAPAMCGSGKTQRPQVVAAGKAPVKNLVQNQPLGKEASGPNQHHQRKTNYLA